MPSREASRERLVRLFAVPRIGKDVSEPDGGRMAGLHRIDELGQGETRQGPTSEVRDRRFVDIDDHDAARLPRHLGGADEAGHVDRPDDGIVAQALDRQRIDHAEEKVERQTQEDDGEARQPARRNATATARARTAGRPLAGHHGTRRGELFRGIVAMLANHDFDPPVVREGATIGALHDGMRIDDSANRDLARVDATRRKCGTQGLASKKGRGLVYGNTTDTARISVDRHLPDGTALNLGQDMIYLWSGGRKDARAKVEPQRKLDGSLGRALRTSPKISLMSFSLRMMGGGGGSEFGRHAGRLARLGQDLLSARIRHRRRADRSIRVLGQDDQVAWEGSRTESTKTKK